MKPRDVVKLQIGETIKFRGTGHAHRTLHDLKVTHIDPNGHCVRGKTRRAGKYKWSKTDLKVAAERLIWHGHVM